MAHHQERERKRPRLPGRRDTKKLIREILEEAKETVLCLAEQRTGYPGLELVLDGRGPSGPERERA